MKRSGVAVALLAVTGLVSTQTAVANEAAVERATSDAGDETDSAPVEPAEFAPCQEPELAGMECAEIEVPLDHDDPDGESVNLALSRLPSTGSDDERLGALVIHPGGPGAPGRGMIGTLAQTMPSEVRSRYDLIGVDTRGVGGSTPALSCDPEYFQGAPDPVPQSGSEEKALLERARDYSNACADADGELVSHMDAEAQAHDLDAVRAAIGEERINYLGYGYGGYLGAVYASEYPDRLDGLILDSTIRPDGRWFQHYLTQAAGFDRRAGHFFEWMAQHDDAYGLGTDAAVIEDAYYDLREAAADEPIGGTIGPFELVTTVENIGWERAFWPLVGEALSDVIVDDDPTFLGMLHDQFSPHHDDGTYASYLAAHCADGNWPAHWSLWSIAGRAMHRTAPFIAWNNIWYTAPCESWSVESEPYPVDTSDVDDALVVHASEDAAMPVQGGYAMHREIMSSRLVILEGGRDSSVAMARGETCVDEVVVDYLIEGDLPTQQEGTDVQCSVSAPDPAPLSGMPTTMDNVRANSLIAGSEMPRVNRHGYGPGPR